MAIARQGVKVFKTSSKSENDEDWFSEYSDFLIFVQKTGYYNFWVDGKHYYYDARTQTNTLTNHVFVLAFNSWQNSQGNKKKKGKITITKK